MCLELVSTCFGPSSLGCNEETGQIVRLTKKRIQVTVLQHLDSRVVAPTGIEPASRVPETLILSIELRSQKKTVRGERTVRFFVEIRGFEPRTSCMPCKRSSQLSYTPSTRWFPTSLWKRGANIDASFVHPTDLLLGDPDTPSGPSAAVIRHDQNAPSAGFFPSPGPSPLSGQISPQSIE